jgi:cell division transport system ATP-binding protein
VQFSIGAVAAEVSVEDAGSVIVRARGASVRYGTETPVLTQVDLALHAGSFHFVVGPSGAGKSSLLRLLSLSLKPCAGTIMLFERDVLTLSRADAATFRRRLAVIFQDLRLLDHLSAVDNAALPLRIAGCDPVMARGHAAELLVWLGLGDALDALPPSLSMGQRQLVAAARAVAGRPQLLLADEPTSYLDPELSARLMRLFAQLNRLGTAVLLATHSRDLLRRHPYPVLRIENGRVCSEQDGILTLAA